MLYNKHIGEQQYNNSQKSSVKVKKSSENFVVFNPIKTMHWYTKVCRTHWKFARGTTMVKIA
jgi:hypothetical protein